MKQLFGRDRQGVFVLDLIGFVVAIPAEEVRQGGIVSGVCLRARFDGLPIVEVDQAPHAALLPHCAALLCQGGHGTLLRGLMHDLPVLCIPTGRDQFDNAQRLVTHGAGVRLRRGCSVRAIRRAVESLLREPAWRERAASLGAAIRAEADHGRRAADLLERAVVESF